MALSTSVSYISSLNLVKMLESMTGKLWNFLWNQLSRRLGFINISKQCMSVTLNEKQIFLIFSNLEVFCNKNIFQSVRLWNIWQYFVLRQ